VDRRGAEKRRVLLNLQWGALEKETKRRGAAQYDFLPDKRAGLGGVITSKTCPVIRVTLIKTQLLEFILIFVRT